MKNQSSLSLASTIRALLAPGKGLLAADESFPTIEKRFREINLPSTEENRRAYREMLFTTPGLNRSISGVILFDETIRQEIKGAPIPQFLARRGIVPGIKVDHGTVPLPGFPGEKMTEGLDGLPGRLAEYRRLGARFTKWRAVFAVGRHTATGMANSAHRLALFAALSQEAGLVPIVEPEILMDGNHSLARAEAVSSATLESVFRALAEHRVRLEHMLLKTSMVVSGSDAPDRASPAAVAAATLRCFRHSVPAAVPGIVFLSGGQSAAEATRNLRAVCALPAAPWKLTFSFGRALQDPALEKWQGLSRKVPAAQRALVQCAQRNGSAVTP